MISDIFTEALELYNFQAVLQAGTWAISILDLQEESLTPGCL